MGYTKQNFKSGDVLMASQLNAMDEQIAFNEQALAGKQPKGNYLTKTEAESSYQPKGDYLTEHQDISGKVDKIPGKWLSTEDFTTALKQKLESLKNFDSSSIEKSVSDLQTQINTLLSGNVSAAIESFNEIIAFLEGIEDSQDLSSIISSIEQSIAKKIDATSLANVATSGSYNDLKDKPNIPSPVTESTVSGWGFTKNNGNVTGVKINGTTKSPSEGIVDLGRVPTEQDLLGKQDTLKSSENIKTINGQSILGSGNIEIGGGEGDGTYMNYDLNIKAINHRGHSIDTPENTIPAYIRSKEAGFTYVEADVAFTSDNVAVLLHDATIDRTSNGSGSIKNLTYEKVLQYDFGSWFSSEFEGVKIPTFKEFIVLCKRLGLHPYIELKSSDSYTQSQISQIVKEVEDCGMKGKVTYISFNNTFLGYVKNADDTARLGYLITTISSTYINQALALRSGKNEVFIDAKLANLNESRINSCITNDFPLEVWTVNTEQEILNMSSYVSGVTSDNLVAGKVLYEAALTYIPPVSSFVPTNAITLSQNSLEFTNKEALTLVATLDPSNASDPVVWKSSNTAVATVNNGVVTPLADGTCSITATSDDKSVSCSVNVVFAKYSVASTLSGCSLSNLAQIITIGDSYVTEVTPDTGYSLKNAQIQVTMGGVDITSSCYSNGIINIKNVTGNIAIDITCIEVPVYTITRELTGCTSNKDTTSIGEGNPYTEEFTALEGFRFYGASVYITMGGKDITDSSYNEGVLNILEVTGNIIIHIAAEAIPVYSIVRNLVNCTSDKTTTSVYDGDSYTETITANDGYTLRGGNISITMGGKDISSFLSNTGVLTIDLVTDDIVINVEAVEYNAALPIVELDLANVGEDGVIKNLGTGGSTYDATIQTTSTSDSFAVSSRGLTLKNHAYANIPYALKSTDKFTIICKGKIATKSSQTYQRFFRTDTDAPSWYYSKSNTKLQAKLSGKNSIDSTISILGSLISAITGTNNGGNSVVFNTDTTTIREVMFTCDGTDIKLYIDGKLSASQPASGLTETTYIGIGDNSPSTKYYASALEISRFTIYDSVITDSDIDEPGLIDIRLTSENLSQGAINSLNEPSGSYELISPYRTNMPARASTTADLSILVDGGKTVLIEAVDKSGTAMQVGIQTFNDDALEALSKEEPVYPYLIDSGWISSGGRYQIPITHKYAWIVVSYPNTSLAVDVNNIDYIQITEVYI